MRVFFLTPKLISLIELIVFSVLKLSWESKLLIHLLDHSMLSQNLNYLNMKFATVWGKWINLKIILTKFSHFWNMLSMRKIITKKSSCMKLSKPWEISTKKTPFNS